MATKASRFNSSANFPLDLTFDHIACKSSVFHGYANKLLHIQSLTMVDSGEQSVGKSYALNHFVDTSFAGSAMRCTEGVWLSLTPTDEELIVSLDFEGVEPDVFL